MNLKQYIGTLSVTALEKNKCGQCGNEDYPILQYNENNNGFKGICCKCKKYIKFVPYDKIGIV
jgi:hypothetical protein